VSCSMPSPGCLQGADTDHWLFAADATAAGDPIEIGAAAEVLMPAVTMPGLNRLPLALASSKSFLGHSEPAAGVVGMLHAAHMLGHAMLPPIARLLQLNPYVEAAVAATHGQWSMPRQSAGLVAGAASAASSPEQQALRNVGTSAFAFQGEMLRMQFPCLSQKKLCYVVNWLRMCHRSSASLRDRVRLPETVRVVL
jgi:hypothetical protein